MKRGFRLFVLACATLASNTGQAGTQEPQFDLIIRGGTVIDGTGSPGRVTDVAIIGGRIARLGNLARSRAKEEIDARGLYVAPGFINIHSHATLEGLAAAETMLQQGVTTEITNADGSGPLDLSEQLDSFASASPAVNIGAYIGLTRVWVTVIGDANRRPSAAEMERMRQLVVRGLGAGAWGVSGGLDYKPAYYATTQEVIQILDAAQPWRTNFPNHERLTPETNLSSKVGIAETIEIGVAAGVMPVVTHAKVQGREQGTAPAIVAMMTRAPAYVAGDVYPYLAGMTALRALFIPGWALEGGRPEMLKRFRDPEMRSRIASEAEQLMTDRVNGPANLRIVERERGLTDIMQEMGVGAGEAIIRILEESDPRAIGFFGAEEDLRTYLRHPTIAISCDCGATAEPVRHPRGTGTFPRVLGRYVREQGILTWEDAIRKMTGLPANIIGLADRGFLAPGMAADVAIFDPRTIADRSTYEDPQLLAEGMKYVLVNGGLALKDGRITGLRAGSALRRGTNMPSRPMSAASHRQVTASATLAGKDGIAPGPVKLSLSISQEPGSGPLGTLRIIGPDGKSLIGATTLGMLQTNGSWSGLTGQVTTTRGTSEALLVTVDKADPLRQGAATITLRIGDQTRRTGFVDLKQHGSKSGAASALPWNAL